jgi:hypothetical protein
MNIKSGFISALAVSLLLATQTAHADFRKALDAYIARDGDTMLKEVKDAVDKKNDDGLMLLLMATNMDAATSDYDETTKQSKSTLRAILPQPKWSEMRELLVQATNNSKVDAQYFLNVKSQFSRELLLKKLQTQQANASNSNFTIQQWNAIYASVDAEYAERGSYEAIQKQYFLAQHGDKSEKYDYWLTKYATAGDPLAQLMVGLKYMNYKWDYGCDNPTKEPICQTKDETKGSAWLKRAVKSFEASGHDNNGILAGTMCDLTHINANGDEIQLKQAYLWCLYGFSQPENGEAYSALKRMYEDGTLKIVAPEVYAQWGTGWWGNNPKMQALLYRKDLKELPNLLVEARKELIKENAPTFTAGFPSYELNVYEDGHVMVVLGDGNFVYQDKLMTMPPRRLKSFFLDLKKAGFYEWAPSNPLPAGYCDNFCPPPQNFQFTQRANAKTRRVSYVAYVEQLLREPVNVKTKQIAKITNVVEKYFPTQSLRCGLGNSDRLKETCTQQENQLRNIDK